MKMSNVSFGSIMVCRLKRPGNLLPLKDEISLSFPDEKGIGGDPALKDYRLSTNTMYPTRGSKPDEINENEAPDGTVYNAFKNYALKLDDKYRQKLGLFKDNPKEVIFTEVDFFVSPRKTEKRYFLTAATPEDEIKIHKTLSKTTRYLVGRW